MGLLSNIIALAIGVYAGIYADQNYKIPAVDHPQEMWKSLTEYIEQYKKDHPRPPGDKK